MFKLSQLTGLFLKYLKHQLSKLHVNKINSE